MESMKSSTANHSHHPNKVAINSLETDSNKQTITSNVSGSTLNNNNKTSGSNQQQQQSATESKENNFEYDDNEWDVGGIGDLIKDLDNDIKKTSETVSQNVNSTGEQSSSNSRSSSSSPSSLSTPSNTSSTAQTNPHSQASGSSLNSRLSEQHDNKKKDLCDIDKSSKAKIISAATSTPDKNPSILPKTSTQTQSNKQKHLTLLDQENTKKTTLKASSAASSSSTSSSSTSAPTEPIVADKIGKTIGNMSSNTAGQTTGKTGNKVSIDHQATLDKGLKMKIKRTKPGTKTSEAKHEIVKAEQNGSLSGADDSNSSSSGTGSGTKKLSLQQQNQQSAAGQPQTPQNSNQSQANSSSQQISSSPALTSTPNTSQTNKRTNSSHRRDKARDKTSYSQRDKASNNSSASVNNSNSNSNLNSSDAHNNLPANSINDRTCSCSHDMNGGNGGNTSLQPCGSITCTRIRTTDTLSTPTLSQRITSASIQSNTNMPNANVASAALNSTPNNSYGSNVNVPGTISSSKTPNAPGPPTQVDGKCQIAPILLIHAPASQMPPSCSSFSTTIISHIQQQSQQTLQSTNNISTTLNSQSKSTSSSSTASPAVANSNAASGVSLTGSALSTASTTSSNSLAILSNGEESTSPPPAKKIKCELKDMVDVCVGTSVGTITEPDCLGPCEPGTSVTLEGIVWHETEGGVLVVNVTWRGKTYVGTLLDCTRHDWAPPRFCDSPTEELDSRTPKGRAKRGRSAAQQPTNDLSNFTETRSSVHSKLRNASAKGRARTSTSTTTSTTNTTTTTTATSSSGAGINNANSSSNSGSNTSNNTPSTSPTAFLPPRAEKRKSKDDSPPPSFNGSDSNGSNSGSATQSVLNPVTGLNVQIPTKKIKTATPCAISPVLLECPEQDCSKKYKHANGLKYHQSHAHGAGSMDEDSQQLPESPRVHPPTTPSPSPSTPQPTYPIKSEMTSFGNYAEGQSNSQPPTPGAQIPQAAQRSRTPTPPLSINAIAGNPATQPPTGEQHSTANAATNLQSQQLSTPLLGAIPSIGIAGGSITTGIATGAHTQPNYASQPQQQVQNNSEQTPAINTSSPSAIPAASDSAALPLVTQPLANNSIVQTPTKSDSQSKVKSGVLRFGPAPTSEIELSRHLPNSSPLTISANVNANFRAQQNALLSTNVISSLPTASTPGQMNQLTPQALSMVKTQKKQRKEGTNDFDNTSRDRDDVQSPAYSDISDDSTPVTESEMGGKNQAKHSADILPKKVGETLPSQSQMGPLGYGIYPYYQHAQPPYLVSQPPSQAPPPTVPSDHSNGKPSAQPPIPTSIAPGMQDYNKVKEPPLDLMTKPPSQPQDSTSVSIKENIQHSGAPPHAKFLGNFYPYNYMPPGYPYNIDPNYGPVSMVSDDGKMPGPQSMIKEERLKESPSPNDNPKSQLQNMSTKMAKTEQLSGKDLKQPSSQSLPPSHEMHPKDMNSSPIGSYSNMFPRHGPQSQQHIRDEELRRYYGMYPDQRRSSASSNASSTNMPQNIKDEPQSPSQQAHTPSQNQQHREREKERTEHSQPKNLKSSTHNSSQQQKQTSKNDAKNDEKDASKVKQEGQKPTMETQGPPPPPTSQYYIHPPYMSPGPFGFEPPAHMYRNMMVPTPYNTSPYHLQMSRFHAPEDLSRNTGTKALDILQHHANQFYNPHKIHELSERALKSPTSNSKAVSSPSVTQSQHQQSQQAPSQQQSGQQSSREMLPPAAKDMRDEKMCGYGDPKMGGYIENPNSLNLQAPPPTSMPSGNAPGGQSKVGAMGSNASNESGGNGSSPPPQRHVHTHHHTHVGVPTLGFPMYPAAYGAAVLAPQQAAVAVINPFPPGPNK